MSRRWIVLAIGAVTAAASWAEAQTPFNAGTEATSTPAEAASIGGTPTIDMITLDGASLGVPLRFAGIVAGSERVELDGRKLVRGVDYRIDHAAGVLYLGFEARAGSRLIAAYRHDKALATTAQKGLAGAGAFSFQLVPGGLNMVVGLGMTERTGDGNVLSSNIFGWNNSFSLGAGKLSGLFLVGDRQRVQAQSLYEYEKPQDNVDVGRSQFLVQEAAANLGGGSVSASYQDISKNFTGFSAVEGAGYDAKLVQQFQKERGLKRFGMGLSQVGLGDLKLSSSFKTVGEGSESIDWRSLNVAAGAFSAEYSSQRVGSGFTRFKDLAEEDRGQLAKERGMSRERMAFQYKPKGVELSFSDSRIGDGNEKSIANRDFSLKSGAFALSTGTQSVDEGFSRIGSLLGPEQQRLAREVGASRSWTSLEWGAIPGLKEPLKYTRKSLVKGENSFESTDVRLAGSNWTFESTKMGSDDGFVGMGAMQDAERAEYVKSAAGLYAPNLQYKPDDVQRFLQGAGIDRSGTRLSLTPSKSTSLSLSETRVGSSTGGAKLQQASLSVGALGLSFRKQTMDDGFSDLSRLMQFERMQWGTLQGLDRTDWAAGGKFGGSQFSFTSLTASAPSGDASHQALKVSSGPFELEAHQRDVDASFSDVRQLLDPDKDNLFALRGYKERDVRASWAILPNLKLNAFLQDGKAIDSDEEKYLRDFRLSWTPDANSQVGFNDFSQRDDDPLRLLFGNNTQLLTLTRKFGSLGTFRYARETKDYDGELTDLPDSKREYVAVETKLDPKTTLLSEQTNTTFENGGKESVSTNTVSTEISKRVGVSISDVQVERNGEQPDETKRNYGMWLDFGRGIRLSYGYIRNLADEQAGTQQQQLQITPGTVGGITVGQGQYVEQRWDGLRTKSQGGVQVSASKPFSLGPLAINTMKFGFDSAADRGTWLKEDKSFQLQGNLFKNTFGVEYRGRMHPSGIRAIDRLFTFATDQSETQKVRATLAYKVRTLPDDENIMIRNFNIVAKPFKDFEVSHQLLTNPEVAKGDALLGTITQASQVSAWKLDYKRSKDFTIGAEWKEIMDPKRPLLRTAGINLGLFGSSGSPLYLYYGLEQADLNADTRRTTHRYHLRFDQKPGPNQMFSFFIGNVSYQHSIIDGQPRSNWTLRLDYQLRF